MKHVMLCAFFVLAGATIAQDTSATTPAAATTPRAAAVMPRDTAQTTSDGHGFIVPAGWSIRRNGAATIVEAPEAGSRIALIDVAAKDADALKCTP